MTKLFNRFRGAKTHPFSLSVWHHRQSNIETMPVVILEARDCVSPLFLVRTWALLCGCLTFSLVASMKLWQPHDQLNTLWVTYMFTWCFFFTLTLLIHILNVLRFHSLLPISWKNMTVTVAALGALMTFSASVLFSWTVMSYRPLYKPLAAAVASCLTVLAYCSEVWVIRRQTREQRGYMASLPGFLKILQCWGGCQMIPLFMGRLAEPDWQLWLSVGLCNVCLLMSLASITVILCDCTGRCPFPFDRLLAAFSLLGVVLYMIATVISVTNVLLFNKVVVLGYRRFELAIMETVIVSITLLAYTVDFSISIKLLCERVHG